MAHQEYIQKADDDWLDDLKKFVEHRPMTMLRFNESEWELLGNSRRGVSEFTIVRQREMLESIKVPGVCILIGKSENRSEARFCMITSRSGVATLESRIKIMRAQPIQPSSVAGIGDLIKDRALGAVFSRKVRSWRSEFPLSPKLSVHLVEKLADIPSNRPPMRSVIASLSAPKYYRGMEAFQEDAVQSSLKEFGLSRDDQAVSLDLARGQNTALSRTYVMEDGVIEHDARTFPTFNLVTSYITGRAVFEKNGKQLEIYTANRRPLEHVFGVDLVYFNRTDHNIVMVQYKMLERHEVRGSDKDWIFRPDKQFDAEIKRMKKFHRQKSASQYEYRLNSQVFYLKFVQRNGALTNAAIVLPLDQFESVRADPSFRGPRGGFCISYNRLSGRYLRQGPFLNLISAGYIGSTIETTADFDNIISEVVNRSRSAVVAINSLSSKDSFEEI